MDKKQQALRIHQLLVEEFGYPDWRPQLSPVGELISTILSQNTNDNNRDAAYDNLRDRYPTWEEVRDAPEKELSEVIKTAGLANQKAPAIQNALKTLTKEQGEITLDFLKSLPSEDAVQWLVSLKGVGPKTAAIVLLFSLGMPAFPVDTHVHRVTGRLGLRPPKMNPAKAHQYLADLFPPETYYPVHLNIIRLGREICQARKPLCEKCPLNGVCEYYESHNE
jgi:endonuclease-3